MSELHVIYDPSLSHLSEVKRWLLDEWNSTKKGFYCNWDHIDSAFKEKQLVVLLNNDVPVGFGVWCYSSDVTVVVNILEIEPASRRKGYGRKVVEAMMGHFAASGIFAMEVQCVSEETEFFFRSLGFSDFPEKLDGLYARRNKPMYKVLVPSLAPVGSKQIRLHETIELWEDEPYCSESIPAKLLWKPEFIQGTRILKRPIISPCHADWRIRWKQNDTVIKDNKVKRLLNDRLDYGKFLVIRELPETFIESFQAPKEYGA